MMMLKIQIDLHVNKKDLFENKLKDYVKLHFSILEIIVFYELLNNNEWL
jgi:hypothetical protein